MNGKAKELREMSDDELVAKRNDLKHELVNQRIQKATGQLENVCLPRETRKHIARIETILRERASVKDKEKIKQAS